MDYSKIKNYSKQSIGMIPTLSRPERHPGREGDHLDVSLVLRRRYFI